MQADDLLWQANPVAAARPLYRFMKVALGIAVWVAYPLLLLTGTDSGTNHAFFQFILGCTALAYLVWAVLLVRDLRSLVEVRVVGEDGKTPRLRMTTTTGRVFTRTAEEIAHVELIYRPFNDPTPGAGGTLRLRLGLRRKWSVGHTGSWDGTTVGDIPQLMAAWQHICPDAIVTKRHVAARQGTGD
ncbi:hypothetical protein ACFYW9_02425 [Streptomyces sp. NPDC002698]|uniref:hypothetical protein n=1 Tax=Streptomyces sp. NPDC002698 TaxID=3364660 RepID=UPI0036BE9E07